MALLHRAELKPTKLELISGWLPTQSWFAAAAFDVGDRNGSRLHDDLQLQKVASFRFDDPAGQVGIETLLVRAGGGPTAQIPLTYREAPLVGAERWLLGTLEHSVLGTRWVYDGCADPVYASALAETILAGGTEAEQYYEADGVRQTKPDSTHVYGSGLPSATVAPLADLTVTTEGANGVDALTIIESNGCRLTVVRYPAAPATGSGLQTLIGTWEGLEAPVVLATARLSD